MKGARCQEKSLPARERPLTRDARGRGYRDAMTKHSFGLLTLALVAIPSAAVASSTKSATPGDLLHAAYARGRVSTDPDAPLGAVIESIELPQVAWPWLEPTHRASEPGAIVRIDALDVVRIDDRHLVLATTAWPVEDGVCGSYGCPQALGLHFFAHEDAGWTLVRRVDVAARLDDTGDEPLRRRVEAWSGHPLLYAVTWADCKQGDCGRGLDVIGLNADGPAFTFETWIGANDDNPGAGFSDDQGGYVDCMTAVKPGFEPAPARHYEKYIACNVVSGHWWIDGDGLEFAYRRSLRAVDDDGHLTATKRWTQRMRLELRKGKLAVVRGHEPTYILQDPMP